MNDETVEFRVRSVLEQAVEDLEILSDNDCGEFELNLEFTQDIKIVLDTLKKWGNKLKRIEDYLDKQHDVPIELLVNIKNIIHSEVEDEVI